MQTWRDVLSDTQENNIKVLLGDVKDITKSIL